MKTSTLVRLSDLILDQSALIIREWTERVMRIPRAREVDRPTLIDHMPTLIEQIGHSIRKHEDVPIESGSNGNGTSEIHGALRFQAGFELVEVVAEYNALREVLYEFAEQQQITIAGALARIVNRSLDHAIAFAVKAYAAEKTVELQRRREEHMSFLVHDLRTPLAAIETAMWILDAKFKDEAAPSAKFLDIVRRNAKRLTALVSQVLQEQVNLQMQITSIEKRELDVWPLVESLIRDLRPISETAQTTVINEIPDDFSVLADARALGRIFQNLLANALKYTKQGRVVIGARKMERCAEFWVEDSGEGIPAERIDKIFEKLETDPVRDGGLGLGLAIVKEMVEAHGGHVAVTSELARGSKFIFTVRES